MAALVVHWLQTLRESVVPEASVASDVLVVDALTAVHYNVFMYVMSFLREVLAHAPPFVFARCLLGYTATQTPTPKIDAMERLLAHFLTTGTL
ncbi:hypothetical protein DYB28_006718 [Aphanomyces astaci]|uniref:Rho-GAP domain-containing protein n=1 Tax=Aphanomyces astaci TaxID=112090 RepID=A0A397BZI7_APHAT|nr:hypothetical protein DYB36_014176 [Aphanomyces astaci]RHY14555.1 hypothetical protein DYB25_011627 [Aphanomyces astaci]RHY36843.1 hypothetical protein DYB38_007779 [Aphanomyces astaci]RHY65272.1 hypothetical protein DYB34_006705 [Aphanomyces astaci]RHY71241.1 hypothetical protein DYB30_008539 [Aphanomyces astaci]